MESLAFKDNSGQFQGTAMESLACKGNSGQFQHTVMESFSNECTCSGTLYHTTKF